MSTEKSLKVTDQLSVTVIPNSNHEFFMTSKDVAMGYGVSEGNIRNQLHRNQDEFKEGVHYGTAVCFSNSELNAVHNKVFWTKRGIVRLGFFIKSQQARLFRDWAEDLVLDKVSSRGSLSPAQREKPRQQLADGGKRTRANRITPQRMVSIMEDICRISDEEVRLSLLDKITGGTAL